MKSVELLRAILRFTDLNPEGEKANPEYYRGGLELLIDTYAQEYDERDELREWISHIERRLNSR